MTEAKRHARLALPAVELAPVRVLIYDDDRDVAKTLARTVERLSGVEAVVATSRAEAFAMACEVPFDLAMVDLGPEMRGVDLLTALRDCTPGTVRVLMSAWPDEAVATKAAREVAARAYVLKPWDTAILMKTLEKLLRPVALRVTGGAIWN